MRRPTTLRWILGSGLGTMLVWSTAGAILNLVFRVVDPDSIDPGDTSGMFLVFGSMGLLSGIVFGILTTFTERRRPWPLALGRGLVLGFVASAIVQAGFLGHGDAGLWANTKMALMFAAFGALATVVWLLFARRHRPGALEA